jgi:cell shape-determining protein MreD
MSLTKSVANKVIAYSFTVGIVIALILGLISSVLPGTVTPILTSVLILMGIIVGFFNITPTETRDYVLYVTAIVIVVALGGNNLGQLQVVGKYLVSVLNAILAFVLPSVIVVAIKAVINLAKD